MLWEVTELNFLYYLTIKNFIVWDYLVPCIFKAINKYEHFSKLFMNPLCSDENVDGLYKIHIF